ncbi:hypothetical protein Taro_043185 [Colocasia esculenta]|uniref:Uncharacterized protein n=1 Tax=Colocasia esculenta TaxID=4460 RepID=A0A843X103_COLES|nr:hypothetical protein [Colocasia esculenta]
MSRSCDYRWVVVVCMRVMCRALNGMQMSVLGRRHPEPSCSGRDEGVCRVPNRCAFLTCSGQAELQPVLLGQGKVCLACSRRGDPVWSGGNAGIASFIAFFTKNDAVTSSVGCPKFCMSQACARGLSRLSAAYGLPAGLLWPTMEADMSSGQAGLSFTSALAASLRPSKVELTLKAPAFTDDGYPAVYFTKEEVN